MEVSETLADYIDALCKQHKISMREASIRAKLAPETISQIMRRLPNTKPRPDTLQLIADVLGGDFYKMMRLAGYNVPPVPEFQIPYMRLFVVALLELPPEACLAIMDTCMSLLRIYRAGKDSA